MKHIKNIFNPVLFYFLVILSACGQNPKTINKDEALQSPGDSSMMDKPETYWKKTLSKEQYYILREKGTEAPYTGKLLMNKDSGVYTCSACGNVLFNSDSKFDSHCGWPSFDEEIAGGKIITKTDNSAGMSRTEIMCGRCGGHLGHLFDDGPTSTGKRYCVNSVSLEFVDAASMDKKVSNMDTLTLGGGCFWCIEAVFEQMKGVLSVESGYSGGTTANPSYEDVCTGNTGHVEVVQVIFDRNITSMEEVLKVFFTVHDPTSMDRQGADEGYQYRSVIYYRNETQKKTATDIIAALDKAKAYNSPIVTKVERYSAFYKAEISHQDYYANNKNKGYCQMVIQPKLDKFEKVFADKVKNK
jgi:peptide methionine sulfoxide reductase msrA/msrB